ncbi:LuxR family transcriptional regulator [Streptomyces sp. S1]|uniref:LuxR family transcriptional regulator n=1 Tax=Streptomyces sp. S1 TaxID=718288 RepID=UPI0027D32CB6|nr:LuxR family transcriptional regulator [Streptomyces sp. S1]
MGDQYFSVAYEELVETGLSSVASDSLGIVVPVPPAAGLQVLSRQRAADIAAARVSITGAFEAFRRIHLTPHSDDLVEVVTGEDIGPRLHQSWASAKERIRQFETPPYFPVQTAFEDSMETLKRGIEQRVLYSREALETPGYPETVELFTAAGENARILPSLPVKLIIIDDAYAMVSFTSKETSTHDMMTIVQPSGLFLALVALFEQSWKAALPFYKKSAQDSGPLPAERRLLSLLAAGVSDDAIARGMGISRRTFFRRIEVIMARLGAETRFQLALQAQRQGWI